MTAPIKEIGGQSQLKQLPRDGLNLRARLKFPIPGVMTYKKFSTMENRNP